MENKLAESFFASRIEDVKMMVALYEKLNLKNLVVSKMKNTSVKIIMSTSQGLKDGGRFRKAFEKNNPDTFYQGLLEEYRALQAAESGELFVRLMLDMEQVLKLQGYPLKNKEGWGQVLTAVLDETYEELYQSGRFRDFIDKQHLSTPVTQIAAWQLHELFIRFCRWLNQGTDAETKVWSVDALYNITAGWSPEQKNSVAERLQLQELSFDSLYELVSRGKAPAIYHTFLDAEGFGFLYQLMRVMLANIIPEAEERAFSPILLPAFLYDHNLSSAGFRMSRLDVQRKIAPFFLMQLVFGGKEESMAEKNADAAVTYWSEIYESYRNDYVKMKSLAADAEVLEGQILELKNKLKSADQETHECKAQMQSAEQKLRRSLQEDVLAEDLPAGLSDHFYEAKDRYLTYQKEKTDSGSGKQNLVNQILSVPKKYTTQMKTMQEQKQQLDEMVYEVFKSRPEKYQSTIDRYCEARKKLTPLFRKRQDISGHIQSINNHLKDTRKNLRETEEGVKKAEGHFYGLRRVAEAEV